MRPLLWIPKIHLNLYRFFFSELKKSQTEKFKVNLVPYYWLWMPKESKAQPSGETLQHGPLTLLRKVKLSGNTNKRNKTHKDVTFMK